MKIKIFRSLLCVVALISFVSKLEAVPQWNIIFNSMTLNSPPATQSAIAGQVNTYPTSVAQGGSGNSVLVQSSFTSGSASLSATPVVFTHTTDGSPTLTLAGNSSDYEPGKVYSLSFDLLLGSSPSGTFFSCNLLNSAGSTVSILSMNSSNNRITLMSCDNINPTIYTDFYSQWQTGQTMHIVIMFNPANGNLSCYVNNWLVGSIYLAPSYTNQGVSQIQIQPGSGSSRGNFAIDNISALTVTTPSIPRWQIDFNTMTNNQPPTTSAAGAGQVHIQPTSVSSPSPNTILVKTNLGTFGANNNAVELNHNTTGTWIELDFYGNSSDFHAGKLFKLEFDMQMYSYSGTGALLDIALLRTGAGTTLQEIFLKGNGAIEMYSYESGITTVTKNYSSAWNPADTNIHHFEIFFDPDYNVTTLYIDHSLIGSIKIIALEQNQCACSFAFNNGSSSTTARLGIDNIYGTSFSRTPTYAEDIWPMGFGFLSDFSGDDYVNSTETAIFNDQDSKL